MIVLYKCHLCGATFKSKRAYTRHINNDKEYKHEQYRQHIQLLKKSYENCDNDDYKYIGCKEEIINDTACSTVENKCENCLNIGDCYRQEKDIYMDAKKIAKKAEKERVKLQVHTNEMKRIRRDMKDSPYGLATFFYKQINCNLPILKSDLGRINNILKSGVQPDQIRLALMMLAKRGETSLRYLGINNIREAIRQEKIKNELSIIGSLPYLVSQYYNQTNTVVSFHILIQDVDRLNQVKHEFNLNQEQLEFIVQYMINRQIPKFASITYNVSNALREFNNKKMNNEFSYSASAMNYLLNGHSTFNETIQIYGEDSTLLKDKLLQALNNYTYNKAFSAIEWLYLIRLPLDKDIYFQAKKLTKERNIGLSHFDSDEEIRQFKSWLKTYKKRFEGE